MDAHSTVHTLYLINPNGCSEKHAFQQLPLDSQLSLRSDRSNCSVELQRINKLVLIDQIISKGESSSTSIPCNVVLEPLSDSKVVFKPESFTQAVQLLRQLHCTQFTVYQVKSERPIYANIILFDGPAPRVKTALELMNSLPNSRCGEWNIAMALNPASTHPPAIEYELESQKMMVACKDGNLAVIRAALDRFNKMVLTVHARDKENWSPLEHVIRSALAVKNDESLFVKHLDCIKLLLDHGASPTARTRSGYTAFVDVLHGIWVVTIDRISKLAEPFWSKLTHEEKKRAFFTILASRANDREVLELFFQNGIAVDVKDDKGRTALHIAVQQQHSKELVSYLLDEKQVDATIVDLEGKTALHLAIQPKMTDEQKSVIDRLVKCSPATVDAPDKNGITPRKLADKFNCLSLLENAAVVSRLSTPVLATAANSIPRESELYGVVCRRDLLFHQKLAEDIAAVENGVANLGAQLQRCCEHINANTVKMLSKHLDRTGAEKLLEAFGNAGGTMEQLAKALAEMGLKLLSNRVQSYTVPAADAQINATASADLRSLLSELKERQQADPSVVLEIRKKN